jgi:hypothetical protein
MSVVVEQTSKIRYPNSRHQTETAVAYLYKGRMIRPENRTRGGRQHCPWRLSPIIKTPLGSNLDPPLRFNWANSAKPFRFALLHLLHR